jgi:S1-C subfamily serine protease
MGNNFGDASLSAFSNAITGLVRRVAPSIVTVHSHHSRGSGFVWRPGRIVTADEALADDGPVEVVLPSGEVLPASVKGRDPTTDIALLGVDRTDLPVASPAEASRATTDAIETGSLAVVVGARDGSAVAALGIVSHAGPAWRSLRGGSIDSRIELDVSLRGSSEGGLVFDVEQHAFGMAIFGSRRRVLAIPMRTIDRVAAQLDAEGRIARGYLGLGLQPVRTEAGDAGAMVMSVDVKGPGARAGVRQGDVIVRCNGRTLDGVATLLQALGSESVGTSVKLAARRAGEPIDFDVMVGKRPDA